jgi:hypothetical protein
MRFGADHIPGEGSVARPQRKGASPRAARGRQGLQALLDQSHTHKVGNRDLAPVIKQLCCTLACFVNLDLVNMLLLCSCQLSFRTMWA